MDRMRKVISLALLAVPLLVLNCGGSGGGSGSSSDSGGAIDLAWDSSFDSGTSGYKVYYGTSSGSYDRNVEVTDPGTGSTVTYKLAGLTKGQNYFVAVTAHDTADNESGYSNEVSGPAK